jgi:hypothetical protein
MVTEETIMAITSNTLHKNFSKQDLLFNQRLFHYRIVLIVLFCSLVSRIYAQTKYAELEWARKFLGYDTNANMAKAFATDGYGNSYVTIVNCNCL